MLQLKRLVIITAIISLLSCGGSGGGDTPPTKSSSNGFSSSNSSLTSPPKNLDAKAGNTSVTLTWSPVTGATSYHVFYATEGGILSKNIAAFQNGVWVKNVNTPYTVTNLQNNKTYYFVVTAVNSTTESPQSIEVSATPSETSTSFEPTAQEVLVVELINRARFDPTAEANRYGISLNQGITGTQITPNQKQPVALNILLTDAARTHSQWMLDNDIFSHAGVAGSEPADRVAAAGYSLAPPASVGENIAWAGTTGPSVNLTEYAYAHHAGLFDSPGHRVNILAAGFREIGVGQKQGYFLNSKNNTTYLASMLTENFATSGNNYFLTGVVYSDSNGNEFYDVGEGLNGVAVTINGISYPVYATGAYSIALPKGAYEVSISGTPFSEPLIHDVQISDANIKLDVIKNGSSEKIVSW
jgi:uncharacterized protein YkwD